MAADRGLPRARRRWPTTMAWLERERGLRFDDYAALWRWSVDDLEAFWDVGRRLLRDPAARLVGPRPGRARDARRALVRGCRAQLRRGPARRGWRPIARRSCSSPSGTRCATVSAGELRDSVAAVAAGLRRLGVGRGDRVVAVIPNIPEAVVAVPGVRQPRRDLGQLLAGLRDARPDRSLRADLAQGAARRRRLHATAGSRSTGATWSSALRAELPTLERTVPDPVPRPRGDRPMARTRWPGPSRRRPR